MKLWRELTLVKETGYCQPDNSNAESELEFFTLHARPRPADRILLFGCSDLNVLAAFAECGPYDVTVTDLSDLRLDAAIRLAEERALDVACVRAEQRRCLLADQSFDAVAIFGDSLAPPNDMNQPITLLAEAKRLLRPSGTLVLTFDDGDWRRKHFPPDDVEMLPDGFIYRRSQLSEDADRLITHEFVASQELGLATERLSVERLLGADQILAMLNKCGFEATSFCKRVPGRPRASMFSREFPPRLYFSGRTGPQRKTSPRLQLVKSGRPEGAIS
ncbi:MAG TPA: class I SAM-dependent methyltransferase [Rhizomicrobium sp.]|nr:class I SAM-dependent methyltransferase [Rhizomicrobium sp.]